MAAYKFFNIGKANAEIDRLAAENTELQTRLKAAEENAAEVAKAPEQLTADLATARQSIASLTAQIDTIKRDSASASARADASDAALKSEKESKAGEIAKAASAKAMEITASQGQPPLAGSPPENPGAQSKIVDPKLKGRERVAAALEKTKLK